MAPLAKRLQLAMHQIAALIDRHDVIGDRRTRMPTTAFATQAIGMLRQELLGALLPCIGIVLPVSSFSGRLLARTAAGKIVVQHRSPSLGIIVGHGS
jgi:hypothetical protein